MEKQTYLDLLAQHNIDSAHPGGLGMTKALLAGETITSDIVILDVGCGTGQTTLFIAQHYPCRVVAVDINRKMLDKANQKFAEAGLKIPLIRADAMNLPFRRDTFDIVLTESVTVFTVDIGRTLKEYYRVLKPKGILLTVEGTALWPLEKQEARDLKDQLGIAFLPTTEQWCQMLKQTGFSDIKILHKQRMSWMGSFPLQSTEAFREYRSTMFRHRKKFGFGVYRCTL